MGDTPFDARVLTQVIGDLREGVQVISPSWRYLYVNAAAAAHGRTTPATLIGRSMMECYPGIEHTEMFAGLRRVMESGVPESFENEFTFADGRSGWFELRVELVSVGLCVLSLDITARRELEQNLRSAMRLESMGRLAGTVAHDFNNLLTIIACHAAFLTDGAKGTEFAEDAARISEAARQGGSLTSRLLAFSRRKPVAPKRIEVGTTVTGALELATVALGDSIELVCELRAPTLPVVMDPGALEQVVLNLVLNARDAMDGQGRLSVRCSEVRLGPHQVWCRGTPVPAGVYTVVSVTDTGCGMSRHTLAHLFDPYFTTKGDRGTGLGLAGSFGLVRQAGGYMSVETEVGRGTTFHVYLPAVASTDADVPKAATVEPPVRAHGTVLVVDDSEALLRLVVRAIRRTGLSAHGATCASDALTFLASTRADLMLTDFDLRSTTGPELATSARSLQPDLRILLMSGYSTLPGNAAVEYELIEKPFSPAHLVERVRATLAAA